MPAQKKPAAKKRAVKIKVPNPPGIAAVAAAVAGQALGTVVKERIANAVVDVAGDAAVPGLNMADAGDVTGAVIDVLAKDKTFVNATNSEAWWQSGVQYGASAATLTAGLLTASFIRKHGFDFDAYLDKDFILAACATGGGVFALIRRFVPGLKPLFGG